MGNPRTNNEALLVTEYIFYRRSPGMSHRRRGVGVGRHGTKYARQKADEMKGMLSPPVSWPSFPGKRLTGPQFSHSNVIAICH